jgi:hypothetical protein
MYNHQIKTANKSQALYAMAIYCLGFALVIVATSSLILLAH